MTMKRHPEAIERTVVQSWPGGIFFTIVGLICVSAAIFWLVIPWAWSPVDDSGLVIQIDQQISGSGRLSGTFSQFASLYQWDQDWGLFRPAYWLYQALFYQLPVSIAHLVRLIMVFAAILGPVVHFRRSGASSS